MRHKRKYRMEQGDVEKNGAWKERRKKKVKLANGREKKK